MALTTNCADRLLMDLPVFGVVRPGGDEMLMSGLTYEAACQALLEEPELTGGQVMADLDGLVTIHDLVDNLIGRQRAAVRQLHAARAQQGTRMVAR